MIGFRCECGAAIDCTYPKCKEGVETGGKDITDRLQDYARDYTTTTYHDDLIREAVTEIESLRQQVTLLREPLFYIDEVAKTSKTIISVAAAAMKMLKKIRAALAATKET
jgi:phage shock protein A